MLPQGAPILTLELVVGPGQLFPSPEPLVDASVLFDATFPDILDILPTLTALQLLSASFERNLVIPACLSSFLTLERV